MRLGEALGYLWDSLFIVVGFVVLVAGFRQWRRLDRSSSWPAVNGRIIRSNLKRNSDGYHVAKVVCEYSVNGQRFECDRIRLGGDVYTNVSRKPAERDIARYPLGAQVLVYYDPSDPGIGCLERAGMGGVVLTLVAGIVFFLGGLAMWGGAS